MSKPVTLLLITLLAVPSLVMVSRVLAQSIPKPSVPEFTLELVDSSYDVPTTHEINPYTGENVTYEGYHVKSTSIQVKIENQPFAPYERQDLNEAFNRTIYFFYNIRIKGFYTDNWIELYNPSDGYPQWSDSQYTLFSYVWGGDGGTLMGSKSVNLPAGGEVDFQVEAMIGYVHRSGEPPWFPWTFYGETSGWSNTQTITIAESQTSSPESTPTLSPEITTPASPTSTPSNEPQTSDQQVIFGVAAFVAVFAFGLFLVYRIKRE